MDVHGSVTHEGLLHDFLSGQPIKIMGYIWVLFAGRKKERRNLFLGCSYHNITFR